MEYQCYASFEFPINLMEDISQLAQPFTFIIKDTPCKAFHDEINRLLSRRFSHLLDFSNDCYFKHIYQWLSSCVCTFLYSYPYIFTETSHSSRILLQHSRSISCTPALLSACPKSSHLAAFTFSTFGFRWRKAFSKLVEPLQASCYW